MSESELPISNRAMTRNEVKYPSPEEFRPERFLDKDGQINDDTVSFAFGAGRRICVGRHIADASVWSAIASILAIFRITKCRDKQGNEIDVNPDWTAGVTSYVISFFSFPFFFSFLFSFLFFLHPFAGFWCLGIAVMFICLRSSCLGRHPHHFPCKFTPRAPGGMTAEKLAQMF
jgi:hypothetical protein